VLRPLKSDLMRHVRPPVGRRWRGAVARGKIPELEKGLIYWG